VKLFKVSIVGVLLVMFAAIRAEAYPVLQLDIIGGYYNAETQTIVSDGPDFTLVALLTPKSDKPISTYLNDTYFISAAVTPQTGPDDTSLGSFTWNGSNYLVTEDMTYGTPPLEAGLAGADPGDLAGHDIFPTFFAEFGFQFSPENRAVTYDTAENPGGLTPTSATSNVSYFATFNVTTSLVGSNEIHFDLYNLHLQKCRGQATCVYDEDIARFAPFSHDAESSKVSEPQSLALMSMGLLMAGRMLRRRSKTA
jgi:hypothetical protein